MYRSQHLAVKYFAAAITLFGVMTLTGLMSAYYYLNPEFLFGILPFNIAKILHIDTMVIWLLMGFIASIYWFLPEELGREPAGIRAAEILFYVFCTAVAVVAVVFVFVQYGGRNETALWFINQGRKYVEAPRWAAIGIVVVMVVFAYNVIGTTIAARKTTGIITVLMVVARPSLGRGDMGGSDRLHHGPGADATARHLAPDCRGVALHRSGARPRHWNPGARASLFLDRHTRLLAYHRRLLLGARTAAALGHGRSCGLRRWRAAYEGDQPSCPLLDDGRGVRQFHWRRRLGVHDHLAASQSLCPWDPVDRIARTFCFLGSLCLRHYRRHLPGSSEDSQSHLRRRVALEVVVRGTQRGPPRDDRCAAGVGFCPGIRRARDRWIDAPSVHCRPGECLVHRGHGLSLPLGNRLRGRVCRAGLGSPR